jgi:hypothetical protein
LRILLRILFVRNGRFLPVLARFRSLLSPATETKKAMISKRFMWLGNLDSNQDKQSQSLLCYRYTIPQRVRLAPA